MELQQLLDDLNEEISRVKQFINEKGYNNGSAFNQIVRDYRTALKKYKKIVQDDFINNVEKY